MGFALRQRVLIVMLLLLVLAAGVVSFTRSTSRPIRTRCRRWSTSSRRARGQSAEEIERYITIPIEVQMAGIPNVQAIRTISLFGLSDVKVQFTYDFTYVQAEQWVINRLAQLAAVCRTARSRRSPRPARSARSSAIAWSGRRTTRSRT